MAALEEIEKYLSVFLSVPTIQDYCPNGVHYEGKKEIKKLATAVSASLNIIQEAVNSKADALLVHHGLFWKGDDYSVRGVKKEKLRLLMENDISLLSYHLPLDVHESVGNNWKAASDLGWENLEPLMTEKNGMQLGVKGTFPKLPVSKFTQQLETYYSHKAHCALGGKEEISSAALISGGAHKYIQHAIEQGVDCFITGSFDEPIWHQAYEEKIHFFALGHSATEVIGPKALGAHLEEKFGLTQQFIAEENPF